MDAKISSNYWHYTLCFLFSVKIDAGINVLGNADHRKYCVPVGGDQLSRVGLQGVTNLKRLSISLEKRYDGLQPVMCEMWHMKQGLLEVGVQSITYESCCSACSTYMSVTSLL